VALPAVAGLAAVPLGKWAARPEVAQVALPAVALAVVEALAEAAVSPESPRAAAYLRSWSRVPRRRASVVRKGFAALVSVPS